jgi:hypothetical protein
MLPLITFYFQESEIGLRHNTGKVVKIHQVTHLFGKPIGEKQCQVTQRVILRTSTSASYDPNTLPGEFVTEETTDPPKISKL